MKRVMRVRIRAPYERIFRLAADVERWPEVLPHYRYVRRLADVGDDRQYAMGARRGAVPVAWKAIQRPMAEVRRIEFRHTGGVTRGMQVAWGFEPAGDAWDVRVEHELDLKWPVIGSLVADWIVGPQFIDAIAGRTLRTIRDLAESGA